MKEFEKWWKKFIPFEISKGDDRNKVKKEYEKAWRVALEWAEKQVADDYYWGYKAIKEELNAKT